MGYIRHNAIVATAWQEGAVDALIAFSESIGAGAVASPKVVNWHQTAMVYPDGSKEGWSDSDDGDERRAQIREWLDAGHFYWAWVEIAYGHDDGRAEIVDSTWGDATLSKEPKP